MAGAGHRPIFHHSSTLKSNGCVLAVIRCSRFATNIRPLRVILSIDSIVLVDRRLIQWPLITQRLRADRIGSVLLVFILVIVIHELAQIAVFGILIGHIRYVEYIFIFFILHWCPSFVFVLDWIVQVLVGLINQLGKVGVVLERSAVSFQGDLVWRNGRVLCVVSYGEVARSRFVKIRSGVLAAFHAILVPRRGLIIFSLLIFQLPIW